MAVPDARHVLSRPGADRPRHRPAQAQHQRHRRPALRARRTAGATPASRSSTWGSTSARSSAPLVTGYLAQSRVPQLLAARDRSELCWHFGFGAAGVGMTLGVIQYVLGARASRHGRPASGAGGIAGGARAGRSTRTLFGGLGRRACSSSSGVRHVHRRRSRSRATQVADAAGYSAARHHRRLLRLAVPRPASWTPDERSRLYRHRRVLPRRRAVLVGVRAGGIDAESVRRSQHATTRSSAATFPSSWFQSLNSLFICRLRAGVRVALDRARAPRQAVEPGEVRARPASASASASSILVPAAQISADGVQVSVRCG